MTVEGLNTEIGSDIPERNCLITCSTHKHARVGLELARIDRIHMTSERVSALWHIEVPEFDGMIHGARYQEISRFVKITLPNWFMREGNV